MFANKGWSLYDEVHQLMPSGVKGKNAYQGSLALQQVPLAVRTVTGDVVGHAGGEPSSSTTGMASQSDAVTWGSSDATIMRENPPPAAGNDDDDIYGPPTPPPPTPSPSKQQCLESIDSSSQNTNPLAVLGSISTPSPSPSGVSLTSRSANSSSNK